MEMARTNLGSMSVDALLKLRDDIEKVLSSKANELKNQLARLGSEIGPRMRGRGSSLKGRRSLSNTVIRPATRGQDEERNPSGCGRS